MGKRLFLFVVDGFGVGESEDAYKFHDEGSNTFENVNAKVPLRLPNLTALGLKNIDGLHFNNNCDIIGVYGKLREKSAGKDTTTGHHEMMGIVRDTPMPTFPNGFPEEIIIKLENAFKTKVLGNCVASGTEIINRLGDQHIKTGYPIVYTSADSVLQIATHIDVVPLEKLYEYCQLARDIMKGDFAVGRVIARPFKTGQNGFERLNENRKDFSVIPDKNNTMQKLFDAGIKVVSVGKISEIFADKAISQKYLNHNNADAMIASKQIQKSLDDGFVFVNLVDTDMLYGHRNDVLGYANALEEIDKFAGEFIKVMKDDDIVIFTGDHGNDPTTPSTDHSREFAPLVMYGKNIKAGINLGVLDGFDNIGRFIEYYFLGTKSEIGELIWKK